MGDCEQASTLGTDCNSHDRNNWPKTLSETDQEKSKKVNMANFNGCTDDVENAVVNDITKGKVTSPPTTHHTQIKSCPNQGKAGKTPITTAPTWSVGKYERAIILWIVNISADAERDLELVDQWLKSSPPHPYESMDDAIDSFFDFGMIVDEATFLGLSDIYLRMGTAIELNNTPWKYLRNTRPPYYREKMKQQKISALQTLTNTQAPPETTNLAYQTTSTTLRLGKLTPSQNRTQPVIWKLRILPSQPIHPSYAVETMTMRSASIKVQHALSGILMKVRHFMRMATA